MKDAWSEACDQLSAVIQAEMVKEAVAAQAEETQWTFATRKVVYARNGDDSLISHATAEEEVKLEQQRCKEEEYEEKEAPTLNDTQFSKLKVVAEDVDEVKEVKNKCCS